MRAKKRFEVLDSAGNPLSGSGVHLVLRDRETGVQYLFVQVGYAGGLTVLVDADGKPLTASTGYDNDD